jgi:hypothetical protein
VETWGEPEPVALVIEEEVERKMEAAVGLEELV